jgi:hypothetical protein
VSTWAQFPKGCRQGSVLRRWGDKAARRHDQALGRQGSDRNLSRTAAGLAAQAGVGRATLYRAFDARPGLHDSYRVLLEQSPAKERSELEHHLARHLAEIRQLKQRITALTTTVEHLIRDNTALRRSLAQQPGAPIADLSQSRPGPS